MKIKKSKLREYANLYGEKAILSIVKGIHNETTEAITHEKEKEILDTFREDLEVDDLSKVNMTELMMVLQPEKLLERFAARKQNKIGKSNDFLEIKG